MWRITLQLMRKNIRTLILSGIAIVIGTAFVCSTFIFGSVVNMSVISDDVAQYGSANYFISERQSDTDVDGVRGKMESTQDTSTEKITTSEFHVSDILKVNGVHAVGTNAQTSFILAKGDVSRQALAFVSNDELTVTPVQVREGRLPQGDNEIAIPQSYADLYNWQINNAVQIRSADDSTQHMVARIVGITSDDNNVATATNGACVLSTNIYAQLFGEDSFNNVALTDVLLNLDESRAGSIAQEISEFLPNNLEIYNVFSYVSAINANSVMSRVAVNFILAFGLLALFVAALVIANTFQVIIAQRRKNLALLRAIGAQGKQLYFSVLFEAGVLGFIASVIGVCLGLIQMYGIVHSSLIQLTPVARNSVQFINIQSVLIPIVLGVLCSVLAAVSAARIATKVSPMEALRPMDGNITGKKKVIRIIVGVIALLVGIGLLGYTYFTSIQAEGNSVQSDFTILLLVAIIACMIVFLGVCLTASVWIPFTMRGVGIVLSHFMPSAHIAHYNIQKNGRRVAATGTALLIGMTLISTVATGAETLNQTIDRQINQYYSVDVSASGNRYLMKDGKALSAVEDLSTQQFKTLSSIKGVSKSAYFPAAIIPINSNNQATMIGVDSVSELQSVINPQLDK
ncbi:MAG: ABC transporter permease, partial [Bifidobacteriaceae bacterium]|nr:ABC transporter permease [Bifidobacteriaceae bacterium]